MLKWFQIEHYQYRVVTTSNKDDGDKSTVTATTMDSDRTLSISIPSGDDDINNDTSDDELYLSSV